MAEVNEIIKKIEKAGFSIEDYDYPTTSKGELHFSIVKQAGYQMVICKEALELVCQNKEYTTEMIVKNYTDKFVLDVMIPKVGWGLIQHLLRFRFINKMDNVYETDTVIDFGPMVMQVVIINEVDERFDVVTSEHLKHWKKTFNECLKVGKRNMLENIVIQEDGGAYIVSSCNKKDDLYASAAGIILADELFTMCNKRKLSLILMPSSIKEFIAIPLSREQITSQVVTFTTNMLREANLAISEKVLANDVFYYDNVEKALFFGDKKYALKEIEKIFE